jgi:hypothetical protein
MACREFIDEAMLLDAARVHTANAWTSVRQAH